MHNLLIKIIFMMREPAKKKARSAVKIGPSESP